MGFSNSRLLIDLNHMPNNPKRIPQVKGWLAYTDSSRVLDFGSLRRLLAFVSSVHNHYHNISLPLSITFPGVQSIDKLTIQILESIIYALISDYHHRVFVDLTIQNQIHTEGFRHSPLHALGKKSGSPDEFIKLFEYQTQLNHYRRIIPQGWTEEGKLGEIIWPDIYTTLGVTIDDESFKEALAEVVTELINNANEHNKSDCLIDIDISNTYHKKDDPIGLYRGVNISVLSLSDLGIGDLLCEKIKTGRYSGSRYECVASAFEHHKLFFNSYYRENDFFIISAFQDRISGRFEQGGGGGTGLTKLIQTLEEYSDSHQCYMVSKDRALYFFQDLLDYDNDGWVAFNHENNFHELPPDIQVFHDSPIIIPGVAYNLCYVYKEK